MRIVVLSSNNDQFFETSGDIKRAVTDESQIARAQEWSMIGIRETRVESLGRFLRPVVITTGNTRPAYPDFTNLVRITRCQRFRIDDDDFLFLNAAAGHERRAVRSRIHGAGDRVALQCFAANHLDEWFTGGVAAGNEQRCFRETVAREERFFAESKRRKRLDELFERHSTPPRRLVPVVLE